MMLFCGVFFPLDGLPPALRWAAALLPLSHGVAIIPPAGHRPVAALRFPLHLAVILGYTAVAYTAATTLARRRLLA